MKDGVLQLGLPGQVREEFKWELFSDKHPKVLQLIRISKISLIGDRLEHVVELPVRFERED